MARKWEYKRERVECDEVEDLLNSLGEDGWELVVVIEDPEFYGLVVYLKREKNNNNPDGDESIEDKEDEEDG